MVESWASWTWIWKYNCWCNHGLALLKGGSKPLPSKAYLTPSGSETQTRSCRSPDPHFSTAQKSLVLTNNTFTGSNYFSGLRYAAVSIVFLFVLLSVFSGREESQFKKNKIFTWHNFFFRKYLFLKSGNPMVGCDLIINLLFLYHHRLKCCLWQAFMQILMLGGTL